MMRCFFLILAFALSFAPATGQALRDINFNFLYDLKPQFEFAMNPVRGENSWTVLYALTLRDSSYDAEKFTVEWTLRDNLSDKNGRALPSIDSTVQTAQGIISFPVSANPEILVAKLVNRSLKRAWLYFQELQPQFPVNAYVSTAGGPVVESYVHKGIEVTLHGLGQPIVSYYNDIFPPAQPPFAESQGKVSKGMKTDSTFYMWENKPVAFSSKGLYLIQRDTNSAEGLALRVEDDYPKYTHVQSIAGPLVYITTAQEHARMIAAGSNKKAFDKVLLGITNDADRARKLVRNFFQRVERANALFTSYKEGWKTDRGMIYIVFGQPDEALKFNDREVWNYKDDIRRASFTFIKSASVFDPDNYVLIRDKKFQQSWYEIIDMWRSARF